MITWDVQHRPREGFLGPLNSTRFDIDVARQNDHITVQGLWSKWIELIVQVGQQVNTHHHFSVI